MIKLKLNLNPKTLKYILKQLCNLSAKYTFKNMIMLSEAKFFMLNTYCGDQRITGGEKSRNHTRTR